MHRRLLAALAALGAALALAAPAGAQALPEPATPELIERAAQRGEVSRAQGMVLLARAILRPGTIPQRYVSYAPWDGTPHLKRLREQAPGLPESAAKRELLGLVQDPQPIADASLNCSTDSVGPLPQAIESEHFFIEYAADETFGGGLTIEDYAESLDGAWDKEVGEFGYAAPPILPGTPFGKYNVRVSPLQPGLYGYVTTGGTYAGEVGDNEATPWTEDDAAASCMVLNSDYSTGFEQLTVGTPRQRLDATTAHEFLHSIQFGLGALDGGAHEPDLHVSEGHATWMEDEVYDGADDNHNYLYPTFEDSMGEHEDGDPYAYWLTWRGLLERFGTGAPGVQEDVIQRFWEITSREQAIMLDAFDAALAPTGVGLAQGFHDYAIAARFLLPCGGGHVLPYCFEEAGAYADVAGGRPEPHGEVGAVGGTYGSDDEPAEIEDNLALNWIDLPQAAVPLEVALEPGGDGARLRITVICDTGDALRRSAPALAQGGATATVRFDGDGCASPPSAVVTNERRTAANPGESTFTPYVLRVSEAPPEPQPPADPGAPSPPPSGSSGPSGPSDPGTPSPGAQDPARPQVARPAPPACSAGGSLLRAAAEPRRRGLAFDLGVADGATVDVDVFQSAVRGRVVGPRLVARFRDRSGSFRWRGRSNVAGRRVRNGFLFVRFTATGESGADVRRVALRRRRGHFRARPAFALADGCGTLASFKLLRPVFGGRRERAIGVAYRLGDAADVTLEVLERGIVVQRLRQGARRPGIVHRVRIGARRFIRGDVRFRLRLERDGRTETARLVARRL